jgi:hypothetical protein
MKMGERKRYRYLGYIERKNKETKRKKQSEINKEK